MISLRSDASFCGIVGLSVSYRAWHAAGEVQRLLLRHRLVRHLLRLVDVLRDLARRVALECFDAALVHPEVALERAERKLDLAPFVRLRVVSRDDLLHLILHGRGLLDDVRELGGVFLEQPRVAVGVAEAF